MSTGAGRGAGGRGTAGRGERRSRESAAVAAAAVAGALAGLAALLVAGQDLRPLWGDPRSVGAFAAAAAGAAAAGGSVAAAARSRRLGSAWATGTSAPAFALDAATVVAAHAGIAVFAALGAAAALQSGFTGLELAGIGTGVAAAVAAGAAAHASFVSVAGLDTSGLARLVVLFMVGGVFASALAAPDRAWWTNHFSQLGSLGGTPALVFNGTLVLGGLVLAGAARSLRADLAATVPGAAARVLPWLLAATGVLLAGIGAVPLSVSAAAHNAVALSAAAAMLALLGTAAVMLRPLGRMFELVTAAAAAVTVAAALAHVGGALNLTGVELIAFAALFGWLGLAVRFLAAARD